MTAQSSRLNGESSTFLPENIDLAVRLESKDKLHELRLEVYAKVIVHLDGKVI